MTGLMAGKRGLIMGLANDRSLAWGIAKQLREQGAELRRPPSFPAVLAAVQPPAVLSYPSGALLQRAVRHPARRTPPSQTTRWPAE